MYLATFCSLGRPFTGARQHLYKPSRGAPGEYKKFNSIQFNSIPFGRKVARISKVYTNKSRKDLESGYGNFDFPSRLFFQSQNSFETLSTFFRLSFEFFSISFHRLKVLPIPIAKYKSYKTKKHKTKISPSQKSSLENPFTFSIKNQKTSISIYTFNLNTHQFRIPKRKIDESW
jgi:hypothetical protein